MGKNKNRESKENSVLRIAKWGVIGNVCGAAVMGACAVGVWKAVLPEELMRELALCSVGIGAMVSGAGAGKGRGVLGGIAGGLGWMAVSTLVSLYRVQLDCFDINWLRYVICAIAAGAFGGVISTGKKPKNKSYNSYNYTQSNH